MTVWSYLRQEGEATLVHLRALSRAKSPADLMDLQAREASRAFGAALNLGRELAEAAGKHASNQEATAKDKQES